ncbi:unnamed protein product, partial [Dicrocoelium dendriticum]
MQYTPVIENPVLWSSTGSFVSGLCLASERCNSLETTLTGYLFNELDWCNTTLTGGIRYESGCGCSGTAAMVYALWKSASDAYSKIIGGNIGIYLNASLPEPFDRTRALGSVELPNLRYPRVSKVTVYLVRNLDDTSARSACEKESIKELREQILAKNITYDCQEDPELTMYYQCLRHPTHERCRITGASSRLVVSAILIIMSCATLRFNRF